MRFDLISVFPEFFNVLALSLVGKAQTRGLIDIATHDLRSWTNDVHHSVDDSPFGGGAGMVMKADVWGRAIDDVVIPGRTVLAIPTPAGRQLDQRTCTELTQADQVIVACGRYEGIDARVADYYRQTDVEVLEYSLGDYVLNGGEVAAIALVEAVARLLPGMVGNPESLREESHGEDGLLEYPVYTRPVDFRGLQVPDVLVSGDHGKVDRWRRNQALERTATRRPDLIAKLKATELDKKDRQQLSELGWVVGTQESSAQRVIVDRAQPEEAAAVAELAGRLFPDACPPDMKQEDIADFVRANLATSNFAQAIADENHIVLVARIEGQLVGYSWAILPAPGEIHDGAPTDVVLDGIPREGPLVYLSKMYVESAWRGAGVFSILMRETLAEILRSANATEPYVWLGTNTANKRAIRAYKRFGFTTAGTRIFLVGDQINKDVTLAIRARVRK